MTNLQGEINFTYRPSGQICEVCGQEIQLAIMPLGLAIPVLCECQLAITRAESADNIARGRDKIRDAMRKAAGLHTRWAGYTFAAIKPREGQERAYRLMRDYADKFYSLRGDGVILSGSTGCGKTMLAAAIANAVIDRTTIDDYDAETVGRSGLPPERTPVRMISTVDLMARIKSRYDSGGAQELIGLYQTARLTILDDVGAEKPTDWTIERLMEIVDHRYSEGLPIVITTNQTPAEMEQRLGTRITDRLHEVCVQVAIKTGSQRRTS